MATKSAPEVKELIELVDPRTRFAKPPFPQEKQSGSGSAQQLDPPADYGENSYRGYGRLLGRTALISGGDSGIGRAIALCFAKEGADVVFAYLEEDADEARDAEETVRLVESAGRKALAIPGDLRQKSFCSDLVRRTVQEFGRLDILVNNAAFQRTYEKLTDIPEEEFDRTYRTNVYGTFFLTQAALPEMKPGGVIINTCSIEAFVPEDMLAPYASTKAALVSLTKSLAKMCMEHGIRVNGVAPGQSGRRSSLRPCPRTKCRIWQVQPVCPPGATGRAGSSVCLPCFRRCQLRYRRNLRSDRRQDAILRLAVTGQGLRHRPCRCTPSRSRSNRPQPL